MNGCPDPVILAAFVEGKLDDRDQQAITKHLAGCPECPVVVGETVRFLRGDSEADGVERTSRRNWRWLAAAAALAAICIPVAMWRTQTSDPLRPVKQLAAEQPKRLVEGRLAGFAYAPFLRPRSGTQPPVDIGLEAESERLADEGRTDPQHVHARGVTLLLAGKASEAVPVLSSATRADPRNGAFWNDLAVAHLALAAVDSRANLTKAREAADLAVTLSPRLAAAHFNRGVALEELHRGAEAVEAYRRAIELEPRSPWSAEAEKRITAIGQ